MPLSRRGVLAGAAVAATSHGGCLDGGGSTGTGTGGGSPTAVPEDPRVDEPPYEIATPPSAREDWNELYLCEHMPAASDLEFRTLEPHRPDPLLSTHDPSDGDAYAVRALTSADEVRTVFDVDEGGDDPDGSLAGIDFAESLVLVVEDGYGSGSIVHHWARVESTENGLHLHGCHRLPFERTDDLTTRHSVLTVERPDAFAVAGVSLTVAEDRRVHFNSTEGVVTVDRPG